MLMNKKVVISMIAVAVVLGTGITILTNAMQPAPESPEPKTSITSNTSKTGDSQAEIITDTAGTESNTVKTDGNSDKSKGGIAKKATYTEFTVDAFKEAKGTRVLFFYVDTSQASKDLDADILKNIKKFKTDTTLFKIDFNKEKDIAKAYGVVKETTILKFNEKTEVSGVFIAYDYPTVTALITNLGL